MADVILTAHPQLLSRADALAAGLNRYFTGEPCRRGHIALRSVGATNACMECKAIADKARQERRKVEKALYDREYRAANAEKCRVRSAAYHANNRESIKLYNAAYQVEKAEKIRQYRADNKDKRNAQKRAWAAANSDHVKAYKNAYESVRVQADPEYRLRVALRVRLATAVREGAKAGSAVRDLGCTIEELKEYLETRFQPGMSWDNWSRKGWHIDHVKPLALFDLADPAQIAQACHYTNLQPLWWRDNVAKGAALNWMPVANSI